MPNVHEPRLRRLADPESLGRAAASDIADALIRRLDTRPDVP
jgi:hypothetical protein